MGESKPIVDTRIRVPVALYETIKQLATEDTRSINAEMVVLLQEAVALRRRARVSNVAQPGE